MNIPNTVKFPIDCALPTAECLPLSGGGSKAREGQSLGSVAQAVQWAPQVHLSEAKDASLASLADGRSALIPVLTWGIITHKCPTEYRWI